jgi:hypothetical protein
MHQHDQHAGLHVDGVFANAPTCHPEYIFVKQGEEQQDIFTDEAQPVRLVGGRDSYTFLTIHIL